ncbi:MAG TPA: DUF4142 domain-containing protein [Gemmatimonadaceae bacterium]|jgi:hypothetical protein
MKYQITTIAAASAAALGLACATNQGSQTQPSAASAVYAGRIVPTQGSDNSSGNDNSSSGMWVDSVGGTWMDGHGGLYMGGQRGMPMGLQSANVSNWTNANIVAHLAAGDSLEIQLSQQGAAQAQNSAVRNFANRMVAEHSAHLQMGQQLASQGGVTPAPAPDDTADAMMATRIIGRLSNSGGANGASANGSNNSMNNNGNNGNNGSGNNGNWAGGGNYDRRFMRAEVMMHQHMLRELQMLRPQASGTVAQLIDQTIPVVQQHLALAQSVWQQVGGGQDNRGNRSSSTSSQ